MKSVTDCAEVMDSKHPAQHLFMNSMVTHGKIPMRFCFIQLLFQGLLRILVSSFNDEIANH